MKHDKRNPAPPRRPSARKRALQPRRLAQVIDARRRLAAPPGEPAKRFGYLTRPHD